jgi:hypothetical protein
VKVIGSLLGRGVDSDDDDVCLSDCLHDISCKCDVFVRMLRPGEILVQVGLVERQVIAVPSFDQRGVDVTHGELSARVLASHCDRSQSAHVSGAYTSHFKV